jgi:hypothetical protein
MNLEHRSGSPSFSNAAKTRADFTYSMVLNHSPLTKLITHQLDSMHRLSA